MNPIDQPRFVEIDQQPDAEPQQAQVRQDLRLVDGVDGRFRFQFRHHSFRDD